MNIAIDIRCLMEKELTGVGEYTFYLLKYLFEIDNTNHYYLFYNSRQNVSRYIPKFSKDTVHYCPFHWPNKLLNLSLKFFRGPKLDEWIIKEKKGSLKINFFFFPNIIFLRTRCPYIITAHDLSFKFFPRCLSLKRRLWHWFIDPKKIFRQAQKVISISQNTTDDLIDHLLVSPLKIKTIPSGLNPSYKKLSPTDPKFKLIQKKYRLPNKFILFLGTLEPRKNWEALILAYKKFQMQTNSNYSLVIAGKPGWKYRKTLRQYAHQPNIIFTDFIQEEEKRYFYNLASVFVFPSLYEGFGFPPLEAMACGCPVITSNNSSLGEISGTAALLIDPRNINDLTEALKQMLFTPGLADYYIEQGLQRAKQFSWYKTAQEVLNLFNGLTKS